MLKSITLLLALVAVVVQVRGDAIKTIVAEPDLTLFKSLADWAGASEALDNPAARITILAPTDEAVKQFLIDMDITADDLKANEALVDAILGYHIVLGTAASSAKLFASGDSVKLATAAAPWKLTASKVGDGVEVTDAQGNTAKVVMANVGTGNHIIHKIDRVLFSGAYWVSLAKMATAAPNQFSTLIAAADKAGLTSVLGAKGFSDTVFVPNNAAFKKAGISLDAPAATIADVLKYHVVKGERTIPGGFTSGKPVATLQGQDITVTYEDEGIDPATKLPAKRAFVTADTGKKAMVVHPNVFVSNSAVHVIDDVLIPKTGAATTAAAAPTAAATTTTKPAAPATASVTSNGNVFTFLKNLFGHKVEITVTLPTMPSPPTVTLPTHGKGRKLLQGGDASISGEYASSIELDSSEQAIQNAVNSQASLSATSAAGAAGVSNAEVLSSYPIHATYADGIDNIPSWGGGGN